MSFEQSKFGDGSAAGSGNVTQTVSNHYGPRDTGKTSGISNSDGWMRELTLDLDGELLTGGDLVLVAPTLPQGAIVKDVFVEVEEVFVVNADVAVGTDGSEATNGVTVTAAQLGAVGTYDVTSAVVGTWAAGLLADTLVGLAYAGTSTDAGKARLVVRYFHA